MLRKTTRTIAAASSPVPTAADATIDQLNDRIAELRARDRELQAEQLPLEKVIHANNMGATTAAALQLLDGENVSSAPPGGARLKEIIAERATIAHALQIGEQRVVAAMWERVLERQKARADDWAELTRERALTVAKLQRLNREAQQMLAPLMDPRGFANMPACFGNRPPGAFLLGTGVTNAGDAYEFLRMVMQQGIVTQGELDQA